MTTNREQQVESLQEALKDFNNKICTYNHQGDQCTTVIFDWENIDDESKEEFVDELFGDWEDDGALEGIIENGEPDADYISPKWVEGDWQPFGFLNLQLDDDEVNEEEILFSGQFDGIFLVKLSDIAKAECPVYVLEVDGTALNEDPEIFVDDMTKLNLTPID